MHQFVVCKIKLSASVPEVQPLILKEILLLIVVSMMALLKF